MNAPLALASSPAAEIPKPRPLWLRFIRWCLPNRVDGLVCLCSTLVLVAIAESIGALFAVEIGFRPPIISMAGLLIAVAGCLCGVAAVAALGRINTKRGLILLASCTAALVVFAFATAHFLRLSFGSIYGREPSLPFPVFGPGALKTWVMISAISLAVFVGVFLFTRFSSILLRRLLDRVKGRKIPRSKLLIATAVVLLVLGTIQNIFFPEGFGPAVFSIDLGSANPLLRIGALAVTGLLGACIAIVLPAHLLTRRCKRRWRVVTLIGMFVLGAGTLVIQQVFFSMFRGKEIILITALLFEGFFLLAVILVFDSPKPVSSETNADNPDTHTRPKYPTVWSLFPVGLVATLIVLIGFFYLPTLFMSLGTNWASARSTNRILRQSNYQLMVRNVWGGPQLLCKLDDDVQPGILDAVDREFDGMPITSIAIAGLKPDVVTESWRDGVTGVASISDSTVRSDQLQDLASPCATMVSFRNVEVVDPNAKVNVGVNSQCFIHTGEGEGFVSLLAAIAPAKHGRIILSMDRRRCDRNELDAIVELSQRILVVIDDSIFNDMVTLEYEPKSSLKNIVVDVRGRENFLGNVNRDSTNIEFALQHDLFLNNTATSETSLFWDLAFAKNDQANPNYVDKISMASLEFESTFRDHGARFHWSFGENKNQQVTDLFLPSAELAFDSLSPSQMGHFKSLETLSFDPFWLSRTEPRQLQVAWRTPPNEDVFFSNLVALPNLKRLDLSRRAEIVDPAFLTRIPNIEHLQIGVKDSYKPLVDFGVCKKLKSLVYFGIPPKITVKQLKSIKELESVIIVDVDASSGTAIGNIENSIPGVAVKVIPESEFVPTPPESFRNHVKERAARIRAEILNEKTP